MPHVWVRGQDGEISAESRAAMGRLQAELAAIEAEGDEEACHLCGAPGRLTEEHTPSKKAGNSSQVLRGALDYEQTVARGGLVWTSELVQGGAKAATLCESCNNSTGRWYNPAYVRLVRGCAPFAIPENAGKVCEVALRVHPQRVAKQALTTLIATSQSGVTARYPHLRELLLDPERRGLLAPLRLGLFLRANDGGRPTGITVTMNVAQRTGRLIAEFSFWPLGWILTFDDQPVVGTVDVSAWTEHGYHERLDVAVGISCQWAIWIYPADFRTPQEVRLGEGRPGP